jgi:hypothetical protein
MYMPYAIIKYSPNAYCRIIAMLVFREKTEIVNHPFGAYMKNTRFLF